MAIGRPSGRKAAYHQPSGRDSMRVRLVKSESAGFPIDHSAISFVPVDILAIRFRAMEAFRPVASTIQSAIRQQPLSVSICHRPSNKRRTVRTQPTSLSIPKDIATLSRDCSKAVRFKRQPVCTRLAIESSCRQLLAQRETVPPIRRCIPPESLI